MIISKQISNYPTLHRIREKLVEALCGLDPEHRFPIQTADAILIDFKAAEGAIIKYEGVGYGYIDYLDKGFKHEDYTNIIHEGEPDDDC